MKPGKGSTARGAAAVSRKKQHRDDPRRLLHELDVHRAELEAQNLELRAAQAERADALRLYTDLYRFAPVGYLTLTRRGVITAANRVAMQQLSLTRARLAKTSIQSLVAPEHADALSAVLTDPPRGHFQVPLEIRLSGIGKRGSRTIQFVAARLRGAVLLAMLDVTELRRLESEIREAARLERDRLRADLHDGLGQELTGLSLALAGLKAEAGSADSTLVPKLDELRAIAARAITTCRTIVHGLAPVATSGGGLVRALALLVKRPRRTTDPVVDMSVSEHAPICLDELSADHLYRIAQEAIQNAIKHARATEIRVVVAVSPQTVAVEIIDNGRHHERVASHGHGLDIMRYRAREVHGELAIVRSKEGTRVRCTCPNGGEGSAAGS
jgi:signal transduction histidine kinase